jgi:hypothetical protein
MRRNAAAMIRLEEGHGNLDSAYPKGILRAENRFDKDQR